MAKVAPVAKVLMGTAFGAKGVHDIYSAGTENTPEAWQQRLQGGAMIAGGAASAGEGLRAAPVTKAVAAPEVPVPGRLKPGYVSVADNDIPVRAEGPIAKAAETVVNPSKLREFEVTKTSPQFGRPPQILRQMWRTLKLQLKCRESMLLGSVKPRMK